MLRSRDLKCQVPLIEGDDVRAVQQALIALDIPPPCGTADGFFGQATQSSVEGYQQARGLPVTGIVDETTWNALFAEPGAAAAPMAATPPAAATQYAIPQTAEPPPLNRGQAQRAKQWMVQSFGPTVTAAITAPFDLDLVCAIACKETAAIWLGWTGSMAADAVLAHCVFDASGDYPGTSRSAFPQNTAAFRARYGDALTDDLIAEANAARALRKWSPAQWVYKGYGIFQYDLQHIETDEDFFRNKLWRNIDQCVDRLFRELNQKLSDAGGDVPDAVRRYNGSGPRAQEYMAHVLQMRAWCAEVG